MARPGTLKRRPVFPKREDRLEGKSGHNNEAELGPQDLEKMLNTEGFSEYLAHEHDIHDIKNPEVPRLFFEFEHQKIREEQATELAENFKQTYVEEIQRDLGITIEKDALSGVDAYLRREARNNPEHLDSLKRKLDKFQETKALYERTLGKIEKLLGTRDLQEAARIVREQAVKSTERKKRISRFTKGRLIEMLTPEAKQAQGHIKRWGFEDSEDALKYTRGLDRLQEIRQDVLFNAGMSESVMTKVEEKVREVFAEISSEDKSETERFVKASDLKERITKSELNLNIEIPHEEIEDLEEVVVEQLKEKLQQTVDSFTGKTLSELRDALDATVSSALGGKNKERVIAVLETITSELPQRRNPKKLLLNAYVQLAA